MAEATQLPLVVRSSESRIAVVVWTGACPLTQLDSGNNRDARLGPSKRRQRTESIRIRIVACVGKSAPY